MQVNFNRYFGVQAAFHQKFTIWGPITVEILGVLLLGMMIMIMGNKLFANDENLIPTIGYDLSIIFLTFYSLYKPRTNPKKTNLDLLVLSFWPSIRFFQSISTDHYLQTHSLFAIDVHGPHRLHVNRADLRGE